MRKFGDESKMLLAHLRVSLIEIIDLNLSQDELKNTVIDYLTELYDAGPAYVEAQLDNRWSSVYADVDCEQQHDDDFDLDLPYTGRDPREFRCRRDPETYRESVPSVRPRATSWSSRNVECCPTAAADYRDYDSLPDTTRFRELSDANCGTARLPMPAVAPTASGHVGTSRDGQSVSAIVEEDESASPPRQLRRSRPTLEQRRKGDRVRRNLFPEETPQEATTATDDESKYDGDESDSLQQIRDYVLRFERYMRGKYADWNRSESNSDSCAAVNRPPSPPPLSSSSNNNQSSNCPLNRFEEFLREESRRMNANNGRDDEPHWSGANKLDGDLDDCKCQGSRCDEFMSRSNAATTTATNSAESSISEEEFLRGLLRVNQSRHDNTLN